MLFVKRFLVSYFFSSLALMLLSIIEVWRFGEVNGYIRVLLFNTSISLLIALSVTFFFMKVQKDWLNLLLGVLPLLPIPILLQLLFGRTIFRTGLLVLIIFIIGLIGYSISAYGLHRRAIRESKEMNHLLSEAHASKKTSK